VAFLPDEVGQLTEPTFAAGLLLTLVKVSQSVVVTPALALPQWIATEEQ